MKQTFLYLIRQGNLLKCGKAKDFNKRYRAYNTHAGEVTDIIFVGIANERLEKIIHQILNECCVVNNISGRRNEFYKFKNKQHVQIVCERIVSAIKMTNPFYENLNSLYEYVLECVINTDLDCESIRNKARHNGYTNNYGVSLSTNDIMPLVKEAKYQLKKGGENPIDYTDRVIFRKLIKGMPIEDISTELLLSYNYVYDIVHNKYSHLSKDVVSFVDENKYISGITKRNRNSYSIENEEVIYSEDLD